MHVMLTDIPALEVDGGTIAHDLSEDSSSYCVSLTPEATALEATVEEGVVMAVVLAVLVATDIPTSVLLDLSSAFSVSVPVLSASVGVSEDSTFKFAHFARTRI